MEHLDEAMVLEGNRDIGKILVLVFISEGAAQEERIVMCVFLSPSLKHGDFLPCSGLIDSEFSDLGKTFPTASRPQRGHIHDDEKMDGMHMSRRMHQIV